MEHLVIPHWSNPSVGMIKLQVHSPDLRLISNELWFLVLPNCRENLLGMDFLTSSRSVLELNPERPYLWLNEEPKNISEIYKIYEEVEVNGTKVKALVDTGCTEVICCPPGRASELQLQVEKLKEPYAVNTLNGMLKHDSVARNVAVKAFGRKAKTELLFGDFGQEVLIGMPMLLGHTIRFSKTGAWDISRRLTRQAMARFQH